MKFLFTFILSFIFVGAYSQHAMFWAMNKVQGSSTNGYRRTLTVDHTKVPNTDQSSFPILFQGTYTYLKTIANGGLVQNASGYDIVFSSDAGGTSLLNWEIESYNPATGFISAWINIPTLSHTTDNVIYLRYGKTGISTFQGGSQGVVWDAGYTGGAVWHMSQVMTTSGTLNDATTHGLNPGAVGTWVSGQAITGQIGGSIQLLNASNNGFYFPSGFLQSVYTLEGWFNISVADGTSIGFGLNSGTSNTNWFSTDYRFYSGFGDIIVDVTPTPINTWTYLVIAINGTSAKIYHNGALQTSNPNGAGVNITSLGTNSSVYTSDIKYDEIRMSTVERSGDWVATEYNNQSSPSTFYGLGSQVAL